MTWIEGLPWLLWSIGGALALGTVGVYYYFKICAFPLSKEVERALHGALFLAALLIYIGLFVARFLLQ